MGYSIETYQREDGWWSFRVNGQESRYKSSSEAGLQRTINALLQGPAPGTVRLKAVVAGAKPNLGGGAELVADSLPAEHWSLKPTTAERVTAFLAR